MIKKYKKYIYLIVFLAIILFLFILSIIKQFSINDGMMLSLGTSSIKYLFVGFIVLLPIFMIIFIILISNPRCNKIPNNREYFNIDFIDVYYLMI